MSKRKVLFSIAVGGIYVLFGIVQILGGILPGGARILQPLFIPSDIIQGFVLCVIGAVLLYGAAEIHKKRDGGDAFLYVGILLSILFGIIMLLDLGAEGINTILFGGEGGNSWSLTQFIVPMIYLAVFSVAGFFAWCRGTFLSDLMGA